MRQELEKKNCLNRASPYYPKFRNRTGNVCRAFPEFNSESVLCRFASQVAWYRMLIMQDNAGKRNLPTTRTREDRWVQNGNYAKTNRKSHFSTTFRPFCNISGCGQTMGVRTISKSTPQQIFMCNWYTLHALNILEAMPLK